MKTFNSDQLRAYIQYIHEVLGNKVYLENILEFS